MVNVAWVPPNNVGWVHNLSDDANGTEAQSLLAFAHDRARLHVLSVSMDNLEDACTQI